MLPSAMPGSVRERSASGVSPLIRLAGPIGFTIGVCAAEGRNGLFRLISRAPGGEANATSLTSHPICCHEDGHDFVVHRKSFTQRLLR